MKVENPMWRKDRLCNVEHGRVFRRFNDVFLLIKNSKEHPRAVFARLLVPVSNQPYCKNWDNENDCEHYIIDGIQYHLAEYWPGMAEKEIDEFICGGWEPGLFIRKRSKEILMWIEIYEPEADLHND